jgi:hypothetical protein
MLQGAAKEVVFKAKEEALRSCNMADEVATSLIHKAQLEAMALHRKTKA